MTAPLFDTHIVVDWSARSTPSPARPASDAIWWAVVRDGTPEAPVYVRTRADATQRLADLLASEVAAGRRALIGFDFPFGYPEGVAAHLTGTPHAYALWDWIAARVADQPDNANRRFETAAEINAAYPGLGPAWGRPTTWDHPEVPVTMKARHGAGHPPERRRADARSTTAKTVWQLAYAGSVGSQVLLGLPTLKTLREDPRLRDVLQVWPFDGGLQRPDAQVVLAEIYPSLLQAEVHARRQEGEILDAAQVRCMAQAFAGLDAAGGLGPLFDGPADLSDGDRAAICTEEAWILGLGAETQLADALPRPYLRDPAQIYAQSFATVRAEASLDALPPALHETAIRIIHACGMVEVAADLAHGGNVATATRDALAAGAPILCDCQMVASGIIRRGLPPGVEVLTTITDPQTPAAAKALKTTRSAAAVSLWADRLDGAVVAIGNAPTALFHLLEMLEAGAPKPAAIFGFPVGFVGAAESKAALASQP
ncbi:MAG: precorrin-8X methylmutase, partial [Pseudomonadota bacterium]